MGAYIANRQNEAVNFQGSDGVSVDISSTDYSIPTTTYTDGVARGLYVGTGGDLKVTMEAGTDITFVNVQDGTFIPISVTKVYKTGTTASDIIALF